MELQKYRIEVISVSENKSITANCNAIQFINVTNVPVKVQNILLPNQYNQISFAGNQNEVDVTEYKIDFGVATTGLLQVIKKVNV